VDGPLLHLTSPDGAGGPATYLSRNARSSWGASTSEIFEPRSPPVDFYGIRVQRVGVEDGGFWRPCGVQRSPQLDVVETCRDVRTHGCWPGLPRRHRAGHSTSQCSDWGDRIFVKRRPHRPV
jgi:hypothetical protein